MEGKARREQKRMEGCEVGEGKETDKEEDVKEGRTQ